MLQETHCLFLGSVTGDYCLFLGSLYSDNFSLISYILELKGSFNEIFTKCTVFRKVISFIYKIFYFSDRVPLRLKMISEMKTIQERKTILKIKKTLKRKTAPNYPPEKNGVSRKFFFGQNPTITRTQYNSD